MFHLTSTGIINGVIQPQYGFNGGIIGKDDMPTLSLPLDIHHPPKGTQSFALVLIDHDSIPVCGFSWIHWTLANLSTINLVENASVLGGDFIQGVNSWASPLLTPHLTREEASYYGGMAPPDKAHLYTIECYALDCFLDLDNGFYLNELYHEMKGHILDKCCLEGHYDQVID
ncbi:MAG: YbhB/YbcL family Raf kinase inhibitor-like protein [Turicibacter sp.]